MVKSPSLLIVAAESQSITILVGDVFFSKSPRWEHLTCLLVSITRSVVEYLSIPIRVGQYRMGCVAWNKGYFQF
jgi:hypothetical protein